MAALVARCVLQPGDARSAIRDERSSPAPFSAPERLAQTDARSLVAIATPDSASSDAASQLSDAPSTLASAKAPTRSASRNRAATSSTHMHRARADSAASRTARSDTPVSSTAHDPAPLLLTIDEVAALLRTSRKAIYAMAERGQIPGLTRIHRRLLVRRDDLISWLDERRAASPGGIRR